MSERMGGRVLLIGFGNPGRLDDGLGPALASRIEACSINGVSVEVDYQLVVEHAHEIAKYDYVIFADSAMSGDAPFSFREIRESPAPSLGSHSLSPEALLFLARTMFGGSVKGYLLGIRGYQYDGFGEWFSEKAKSNLDASVEFISELLRAGNSFAGLERVSKSG